MADRFPSIEDLDAGAAPASSVGGGGDFLERERAALGEDADLFAANDKPKTAATVEDDDDLLGDDFGGSAPQGGAGAGDELDDFESSFPAIDTRNDNVGPGGTITNTSAPYMPPSTQSGGYTNYTPQAQQEDSEPIRAWREKRDSELARRDEASSRKKEETVGTARKDIDSFYESYNRKVDKQKSQTAKEAEEFLAKREDTTSGGTSWERIAKLVDLSGKGTAGGADGPKKRMREMLVSLKGDKDAPGAGGV